MHQCPNCDREFEKPRGLETHVRLAHNGERKQSVVETIQKVKALAAEVGGLKELSAIADAITV